MAKTPALTSLQPRHVLKLLMVGFTALLLSACASTPEFVSKLDLERTYYTQVGMWADKGTRVMGTNYQRGTFIPVNSKVRVHEIIGDTITFSVPELGEKRIHMVNVPGHTQADLQELFQRSFDTDPVDLDTFNPEMRDAIKAGRVTEGMTRDEVIATRGYPPGHETPSLEQKRWRYWQNRFGTNIVRFEDGKVAEIIR
jgi:hypothetical protein